MNLGIPLSGPKPAYFLPNPPLVMLFEEMKRSGELQGLDEKQRFEAIVARMNAISALGASYATPAELTPQLTEILRQIDALLEMTRSGPLAELDQDQVMQAIVSWQHAEVQRQKRTRVEPSPFKRSPEFAEALSRIDAARDAEGVPNEMRDVEEFLATFIEQLSQQSLFPANSVLEEWTVDALAIDGMTASARSRLSVMLWVMLKMRSEPAQSHINRNRAKRQRRQNRR